MGHSHVTSYYGVFSSPLRLMSSRPRTRSLRPYSKLLAWSLARVTSGDHLSAHTRTRPSTRLVRQPQLGAPYTCSLTPSDGAVGDERGWVIIQRISLQGAHRRGRLRPGTRLNTPICVRYALQQVRLDRRGRHRHALSGALSGHGCAGRARGSAASSTRSAWASPARRVRGPFRPRMCGADGPDGQQLGKGV